MSKYIRYYTKGKYMGREKLTTFKEQYLTLKSWITSGNDLRFNDTLINDPAFIVELYK